MNMGRLVLLKLDLSHGFDLDRLQPLGSRRDVEARIRAALGPRPAVRFRFADTDNAVTEIGVELPPGRSADTFGLLRQLCDENGWSAFDRETGRFLDLTLANPLKPPVTAAPPFHWWTALPSWVRLAIGLALGLLIFYSLVVDWISSWNH
jgi:hypothetical protein